MGDANPGLLLIGEEYEKKREAVLKFTGYNAARTTGILDTGIELDLLIMYRNWIREHATRPAPKEEVPCFSHELDKEASEDNWDVRDEYFEVGVPISKVGDGEWKIAQWSRAGSESGSSKTQLRRKP